MDGPGRQKSRGGKSSRRKRAIWITLLVPALAAAAAVIYLYRLDYVETAMDATTRGNVRKLKILLALRPELVGDRSTGRTLLHEAARNSQRESAEILLSKGADPDAEDGDGLTPLHRSVADNNVEMSRFLLEHGADVNARSRDGLMPVHRAIVSTHVRMLRLLLGSGADANATAGDGTVPLFLAVESGRPDLLRPLLDHRADLAARDADGRTVLERRWSRQSVEMLRLLVRRRADGDPAYLVRAFALLIEEGDGQLVRDYLAGYLGTNRRSAGKAAGGATLLHLAVGLKNAELVEMLLERDADPNAQNADGSTPLDLAVTGYQGGPEIIAALLGAGANADVERLYRALAILLEVGKTESADTYLRSLLNINMKRDAMGNGLLHWAVRDGNPGAVRLLLARGADIDAANWQGLFPLHLAVTAPRSPGEVCALLLAGKADVNEEDLFDRTALYLAARADADPQVLEVLLAAGAKVEARCDRGFKPLHWAVKNGNRRNVKLLLAHKADVNAPDANRQTPLHYVATNGDLEMAKFLLDNGASYNMKDNSGARPIRCAIRNGHRDIVELLQRVREERLKRDKK